MSDEEKVLGPHEFNVELPQGTIKRLQAENAKLKEQMAKQELEMSITIPRVWWRKRREPTNKLPEEYKMSDKPMTSENENRDNEKMASIGGLCIVAFIVVLFGCIGIALMHKYGIGPKIVDTNTAVGESGGPPVNDRCRRDID